MLQVGSRITRIHIKDPDTHPDNITVSLGKVSTNYGPFHDASGFFELYPIKSGRGDKKFDVILKRPLLGSFEAGDQFNLAINAHDGVIGSSAEVYGRIEEARDPSLHPDDLTTSSTSRRPTTTKITSTTTTTSSSIVNTTISDLPSPDTQTTVNIVVIWVVVPIFALGMVGVVLFCCRHKLRNCTKKSKQPEPGKRDINNVFSNETEITDVSNSRKTSTAESIFNLNTFSNSSNTYESDFLQTKETYQDKWEFPRQGKLYKISNFRNLKWFSGIILRFMAFWGRAALGRFGSAKL